MNVHIHTHVHCISSYQCVSMKRLAENFHFIRKCKDARCNKRFRHVIKNANPEEIRTLSETAKNLLLGNIPMTPRQKLKLKPHKKKIKYLALKKNSISRKKRMLQRGGFWIPLLATLAGSLVTDFIKQ